MIFQRSEVESVYWEHYDRKVPRIKNTTEDPALASITTNNLGPEPFGSKCGTTIFRKMCFVTDLASHGSKSREN